MKHIFSVKNEYSDTDNTCHKVFYLLGMKFSFRIREKKISIADVANKIDELQTQLQVESSKIYNQVHLNKEHKHLNFRTVTHLSDLIRSKVSILPSDIELIVGIPRSGMIPAYLIGLFLNKNICSINEFLNDLIPQKGERLINNNNMEKDKINVLVVDDSVNSGNALNKTKELLENVDKTKYNIKYCAIYAKEESKDLVDYYFEVVDAPRMFQWNYLNHVYANKSCFDMDGVLCVDPTDEQNDDGEKYIDFIKNAKPLYIPSYRINSIVTSRLEKYRDITEQWLKEHNVMYEHLYMLDLPTAKERQKLNCHAEFKANVYRDKNDCLYFIESNREQAKKIAELTGKQTICVETDEYFNG